MSIRGIIEQFMFAGEAVEFVAKNKLHHRQLQAGITGCNGDPV